jgi:uncharacterized protein YndB with AHSA1/START domain
MPLTCEIEETVAAPPERVFECMTDLDGFGQWMHGFVRNERLTPGQVGKGTQFREVRKKFGREAGEVFEVVEFDPPRSFVLYVDGTKGSSKKGWFRFLHTFTPVAGGTRIKLSGEIGGLTGCMGFLGKFMMGPMKKAIRKDLASFKAWVERGAPRS